MNERRLLVPHDKRVEGEPHQHTVQKKALVAEQGRLAQNDGDKGNVNQDCARSDRDPSPRAFCVGAIGAGVPNPQRKACNESTSPGRPATINRIPTASRRLEIEEGRYETPNA